jgi:hypothetical protein
MDPRKHRTFLFVLSAALLGMLVIAVFAYPQGGPDSLPAPLEEVTPGPGAIVISQTGIQVDIAVGYDVSLVIDGVPIPPDEMYAVAATGTFTWRPTPESVIPVLAPGDHTVEVSWDRTAPARPDPGAFSWTFRVT